MDTCSLIVSTGRLIPKVRKTAYLVNKIKQLVGRQQISTLVIDGMRDNVSRAAFMRKCIAATTVDQ